MRPVAQGRADCHSLPQIAGIRGKSLILNLPGQAECDCDACWLYFPLFRMHRPDRGANLPPMKRS